MPSIAPIFCASTVTSGFCSGGTSRNVRIEASVVLMMNAGGIMPLRGEPLRLDQRLVHALADLRQALDVI